MRVATSRGQRLRENESEFQETENSVEFSVKHSWIPQIKLIRAKCLRKLNILKILSHPKTDCNCKILLPFYQSPIRSVLDFRSPVYGLAPPSQLEIFDTIQNSAVRFITGAFRSSPALSLCVVVGVLPSTSADLP